MSDAFILAVAFDDTLIDNDRALRHPAGRRTGNRRDTANRPGVDASEALWRIHDAGIRVRILVDETDRSGMRRGRQADSRTPRDGADALEHALSWLHAKRIPWHDLGLYSSGTRVGADLYVDADVERVQARRSVEGRDRVLVYTRPHNLHLPGPRADDWDDVLVEVAARSGLEL